MSVQAGGVTRLPADILEGQGAPAVLDGLGDVRGVLPGKVWIGAGDVDRPGGAAIAGGFHLYGVQLEGKRTGEAVTGDELPLLGQIMALCPGTGSTGLR